MKPLNFNFWTLLKLSTAFFLLTLAIISPVRAEENTTSTLDTTIIEENPPIEQPTNLITTNLNIRIQNQLIFSGPITIPSSTTIVDSSGNPHFTTSTNVLTALIAADELSDAFSISQLLYYPDWGSFYLKCITDSSTTSYCDNWNYVVNGQYPSFGMDSYALSGNENIYIYFNNSWQITANTSTFPIGTTTTLQTWRYNYDNLENEWTTDGNNLIDISIPNPASTGWWDATITTTTLTSDNNGNVDYLFSATGTYYAKITSADWSKWSWPITIQVTNLVTTTTEISSEKNNPPPVSSGGGGSSAPVQNLDIVKAAQFLVAQQNADGSIGSALYSDWAAIALAAAGQTNEAIKNYLLSDPSAISGLNEVSDNARRAMALMALGINPYNGTHTNYIQKITNSFDGTQFGDKELYNDDIFALFPLLHAGYTINDDLIVSSTKFILSKQNSNGAWDGVDLTAAAVQALTQVKEVTGVNEALNKAKNYLHSQEQADGSWGNIFSTCWAKQAISALDENQFNDYLYSQQGADGGLEKDSTIINNRIWATSYAIPAALNKTWPQILNNFNKPTSETIATDGVGGYYPEEIATTTLTTSTILVTTILPTSTPEIIIGPTEPLQFVEPIKIKKEKIIAPSPAPDYIQTKLKNIENISSAPATTEDKTEKIINSLPLDTPTRRTAKKIAIATGGGAAVVGLYLGLRLLKNMI